MTKLWDIKGFQVSKYQMHELILDKTQDGYNQNKDDYNILLPARNIIGSTKQNLIAILKLSCTIT